MSSKTFDGDHEPPRIMRSPTPRTIAISVCVIFCSRLRTLDCSFQGSLQAAILALRTLTNVLNYFKKRASIRGHRGFVFRDIV